MTVDLERDENHRVRLHRTGHEPHTVKLQQGRSLWASVNLLNLIVPGMLIDLSTGAFYSLDPGPISPALDKDGPSGPDSP